MASSIVPGTSPMRRWPAHNFPNPTMGIAHYGRSGVNGYAGCYKVPLSDAARLSSIGYSVVKVGSAYAYVYKP